MFTRLLILFGFLSLCPFLSEASTPYVCTLTMEMLQRRGLVFIAAHQVERPKVEKLGRPKLDTWTKLLIGRYPGMGTLVLYNDEHPVPRELGSLQQAYYMESKYGEVSIPLNARILYLAGSRLDLSVRHAFLSLLAREAAFAPEIPARVPLRIGFYASCFGRAQ